jgi:hypothetical protein
MKHTGLLINELNGRREQKNLICYAFGKTNQVFARH